MDDQMTPDSPPEDASVKRSGKRCTTPKVDANGKELRTVELSFRLTPSEHAKLKALAAETELSLADFIRLHLFSTKSVRKLPARDELIPIRGNLGKLGSNINQIAHHMNSFARKHGEVDAPTIERYKPFLDTLLPAVGREVKSAVRLLKRM